MNRRAHKGKTLRREDIPLVNDTKDVNSTKLDHVAL